jgi:1-deoxy-D-xylulose-5-phosphate reductoisomerase
VAALSLVRSVTVLGSTGSIGVSTLDLLGHARDGDEAEIEVIALTAGKNVERLAEQALQWRPQMAVIEDESLLPELRDRLNGSGIHTAAGKAAVTEAADMDASWVMSSIVGAAGLAPTLTAARRGTLVALANKESLVCAGPALLEIARKAGGVVVPVDSEHSAIFQSLHENWKHAVSRLILTASGGPFRSWDRQSMSAASPEQAVAHPNWSMGAKISVDSASMMNKALEMIEAAYLFSMPPEQIDVLVHPQSIVHSMVEYADGSTMAQLGPPDMRAPIAFALAWPGRITWPAPRLDLAAIGSLTFEHPDLERFPAIRLARQALNIGGGAPAAMNAANEVAVAAFLGRRIGFLDIASTVERVLESLEGAGELKAGDGDVIESAFAIDALARRSATEHLDRSRLN